MKKLAIFASGSGSNALKIMDYFHDSPHAQVALLCSDNPQAPILALASARVPHIVVLEKSQYQSGEYLNALLQSHGIDLVILAGYLKLIPASLIAAFPQKIINIHPALLPKFGGKGMYGMNIHKAVIAAGEKESGITIHFVDEEYDHGAHIFQASLPISPDWTPEILQKEVLKLEHAHFAPTILSICT